jgi:hypothetical protein
MAGFVHVEVSMTVASRPPAGPRRRRGRLVIAAVVLAGLGLVAYRVFVPGGPRDAKAAVTAELHRLGPFPGASIRAYQATTDSFLFPGKAAILFYVVDNRPVPTDTAALNRWLTRAGYSSRDRPRPEGHFRPDPTDPGNPAGCLVAGLPVRDGQGYQPLTAASIGSYPLVAFRCNNVTYRRPGFIVWVQGRDGGPGPVAQSYFGNYSVWLVRG